MLKNKTIMAALCLALWFSAPLSAAKPDGFCAQATREPMQFMPVWQSLFLHLNPMESDYFKTHVVVDGISINCMTEAMSARVEYHVNIAWASIPAHDQFPIFKEKPATAAAYNAKNIRPSWGENFMRVKALNTLHHASQQEAEDALLQAMGGSDVYGKTYGYYVPGQVPRTNGDPYLMQNTILDKTENRCVFGVMNLRTGEITTREDKCRVS